MEVLLHELEETFGPLTEMQKQVIKDAHVYYHKRQEGTLPLSEMCVLLAIGKNLPKPVAKKKTTK